MNIKFTGDVTIGIPRDGLIEELKSCGDFDDVEIDFDSKTDAELAAMLNDIDEDARQQIFDDWADSEYLEITKVQYLESEQ